MKNRDLVSSIVFMVIGGIFMQESLRKTLIENGVPGAGFMPLMMSGILIILSLSVFISALCSKEQSTGLGLFPDRVNSRKLLFCVIAMIIYAIVMKFIGFFIATFILFLYIGWLIEPKKWRTASIVALFTTVISYLFFVRFMEVQLPTGKIIDLIVYDLLNLS
jgi:putative tricarboxylic transport membrane protein